MNEQTMERFYRERLEEKIVFCLSRRRGISDEEAMRLYYSSRLADRIHEGQYGIQYLDHRVLTDYLEEELERVFPDKDIAEDRKEMQT